MIDVNNPPTQDQITAALMTEIRELRLLVDQLKDKRHG